MKSSLIVVCNDTAVIMGQTAFEISVYEISALAKAVDLDELDIREGLLVMGGEIEGSANRAERLIRKAVNSANRLSTSYDLEEEEGIETLVSRLMKQKNDVYCSFSLVA